MKKKIENINCVKLSGIVQRFHRKESGSFFGRLNQKELINNNEVNHFYEFYIEANKSELSKLLAPNILILIEGNLTIFKFKDSHKVVINVKSLTVL